MNRLSSSALAVAAVLAAAPFARADVAPAAAGDIIEVMTGQFSAICGGVAGMRAFDGRLSGSTYYPFVIPADKVFVVTAFDWRVQGPLVNRNRSAYAYRFVGGGYNAPAIVSTGLTDSGGVGGNSVTFPTGLVIQPGQQFCLRVDPVSAADSVYGVLHGFLAPR
jgi:hypothetical protein